MSGFLEDAKRKYAKFKTLHPREQEVLVGVSLKNPANYRIITESHDVALAWSSDLASKAAGPPAAADFKDKVAALARGGGADAARHCFWSARLASKLGYNDALLLTTAHEVAPIQSGDKTMLMESVMDLHNNAVGLKIGARSANASDADLQKAVLDALGAGELRVLDPKTNKLLPSTAIGP